MSEALFDISLPSPYSHRWREAYRYYKDDSPRLSSYQAPEGEPIPFIYKDIEFSGGQSVDTAEYPFFGLWSNASLNQKPQSITVNGFLRGEFYIQQRTAFLDALLVPTSDDSPGFLDHPLWGRFGVVVESYSVQEAAKENGQCELSLTLKRAGITLDTRATVLSPADFIKPNEVALMAAEEFASAEMESSTLVQAFGQIKDLLSKGIGRIQAAQTKLNALANEVVAIFNLIAQGVQAPMLLAKAFVNAVFAIVGSAASIGESMGTAGKYFFGRDNRKAAALNFLSASSWDPPIDDFTGRQAETKKAVINLYRAVCLCASAELLAQMESPTANEMGGYWALYLKLENSVILESPDTYQAVTEMRSMLSSKIRASAMSCELKKKIGRPVPLLFLSHRLGCDDAKLRAMNLIEDSLLVSGELAYV